MDRRRSNLTLRSLLERIGRAKAAAHCPVDPASLRFNLIIFRVVTTLYFGSCRLLGWQKISTPVQQLQCTLQAPQLDHIRFPKPRSPPGLFDVHFFCNYERGLVPASLVSHWSQGGVCEQLLILRVSTWTNRLGSSLFGQTRGPPPSPRQASLPRMIVFWRL